MTSIAATSTSKQKDAVPPQPSTSGRPVVRIHGSEVPLQWLVQRHDSRKYPEHVIVPKQQQQRDRRSLQWHSTKDQWIAAAAAGFHIAMFCYNLAFWGSEGTPPDRYWPANSRLKMGVKPGRYGNLDGTKRIWYENLAMMEGLH